MWESLSAHGCCAPCWLAHTRMHDACRTPCRWSCMQRRPSGTAVSSSGSGGEAAWRQPVTLLPPPKRPRPPLQLYPVPVLSCRRLGRSSSSMGERDHCTLSQPICMHACMHAHTLSLSLPHHHHQTKQLPAPATAVLNTSPPPPSHTHTLSLPLLTLLPALLSPSHPPSLKGCLLPPEAGRFPAERRRAAVGGGALRAPLFKRAEAALPGRGPSLFQLWKAGAGAGAFRFQFSVGRFRLDAPEGGRSRR
jgi:hypothetical protein